MLKKLCLLLSISAVLFSSSLLAGTKFESAITAAEASLSKAKSLGYEWRDTGKIIKKAKALAKKGQEKMAIKMAMKADKQSQNAIAQFQSESKRFKENHSD